MARTIVVNGEERGLPIGGAPTVSDLIEELGLGGRACAVEVNGRVTPKRDHGTTVLRAGDRIELVTLVGGG